jgi:trimeric autotransporter adhesin
VARWNGTAWSAVGAGLGTTVYSCNTHPTTGAITCWGESVSSLAVFDDGSGPRLCAAGTFAASGAAGLNHVAQWDGVAWTPLGGGVTAPPVFGGLAAVRALAVYHDGAGSSLVAAGTFSTAGGVAVVNVARWNGTSWAPIAPGVPGVLFDDGIRALAVLDTGSGQRLYATGKFRSAGGVRANHIVRFDGSGWSALSSGLNGPVRAFAWFDDGSGPALHAGGEFTFAADDEVSVAKWTGSDWVPIGAGFGGGLNGGPCVRSVRSLAVHDDGQGPSLYAGGTFVQAGGVVVNGIARWNGTSWVPLRGGLTYTTATLCGPMVQSMATYDDGGGPALYAAGSFDLAGGMSAKNIAKWDGAGWSPLGLGVQVLVQNFFGTWNPFPDADTVRALCVHDNGTGPELYAAGRFNEAGGTLLPGMLVARWNGASWFPVGDQFGGWASPAVLSMTTVSTVIGEMLVIGGRDLLYTSTNFAVGSLNNVGYLSGNTWLAIGSGLREANPFAYVPASVNAVRFWDDGGGLALYAGGDFVRSGGAPVSAMARFDGVSWSALGGGCTGWRYHTGNPLPAVYTLFSPGPGAPLHCGGSVTRAGVHAAPYAGQWKLHAGPSIHNRISDRTVLVGLPVGFLVQASGSGPLRYQWRKNGAAIGGATTQTLVLASASSADDGIYDVVVTTGAARRRARQRS